MINAFALPRTLVQSLRDRASQTPEQVALLFLGEQEEECRKVSYRELDLRARTIAASIQTVANPGDRAILLFPSGVDYVATFFGCLCAGVIAVPAYPPESTMRQHQARLLSIIEDATPRLLLTNSVLYGPLQAAGQQLLVNGSVLSDIERPKWLCVDTLDSAKAQYWREPVLEPDDIAFLQYTSGSTAQPKGVQVSHGNLVTNELMIRQGFEIGDGDVIVSWLPLYHDMGLIGSLLQSIFSGVPCVLMSPRYFLERPVRWLEAISQYGGTVSGGPDFAYRLCAERISDSALKRLNLERWQVAFSGAEPIREDSLALFSQKFSACGFSDDKFFPCYGLAEATLFVTGGKRGQGASTLQMDQQRLARNIVASGEGPILVSCGRSQPEQEIRIVDPASQSVVAEGTVGEIWTAGGSITRGYWRNPDATAKTFVKNGSHVWLRTGDLGFVRAGELFVTGRLKDMLIVRGHNLYPQDIERTIEGEIEGIRKGRVAVFAVQVAGVEGIGIAVEVSKKLQKRVPAQALIDNIRQVIAEVYQETPQQVALLNPGTLPKTSSGKLQRSACRAGLAEGSLEAYAIYPLQGDDRRDTKSDQPTAATTVLEAEICTLWCEILEISHLEPGDNFFLKGGNSVKAVQLMAALQERLNLTPDIQWLFMAPTLASFVATVADQQTSEFQIGNNDIPALTEQSNFPLSPGQQRLWFLWRLDPQGAAYNVPGGLRLRGSLNEAGLRTSFQALVERHDMLRTRFAEQDGIPVQSVDEVVEVAIHTIDLSRLPGEEREAEALRIQEKEALTPFDLLTGPLMRITLVRLGEEDHLLLVTFHHIVVDGWSANILMAEFAQRYAAYCEGRKITLPALSVTYGAYAKWQKQWLADEGADRQRAYWLAHLEDEFPVLILPTKRPSEHVGGHGNKRSTATRLSLPVDDTLADALRKLANSSEATLFMVLLAAFQTLLFRYTGESEIQVGVPNANRRRREIQGVVGFFVNTLVIRSKVQSRMSFAQLIEAAKAVTIAAQANQDLPIDQLSASLAERSEAGSQRTGDISLFNVMFNHQQRNKEILCALPGLTAEELPWHSREAKCDLQLQTEEDEKGHLLLSLDYAESLFDENTIIRIAEHFLSLLRQVTADPRQSISDIQLLIATEQDDLMRWGCNPGNRADRWLPDLFAERVVENRDRIALQWDGSTMTYGELDESANRLAHYLKAKGMGPDMYVGILIDRSPQLLIGLLAVLKAGGAYVPLDSDYPEARLLGMLKGSGAKLLLTRGALPEGLAGSVTSIDLAELDLDAYPSYAPEVSLHGDNLAYVLYTSGSTGQPKGVGISHAAVSERLAWMQNMYQLTADDVLLQKTPITFDVSVWECFWPLLNGAKLVLAGPGEHRDPRRLVELAMQYQVSVLHFVPPLLQQFIEEPKVSDCTALRYLFSGGESLSASLRDQILETLPGVVLHNRYGPTETTINATFWPCRKEDGEHSPIGRPLGNVICRVLDGEFSLVPVGVSGELCVGGMGLARGYQHNAAQTALRFVPDPFATEENAGARLYRSGDRVRWSSSGTLEFHGRLDKQVKLRGFRIEPGEIEERLRSLEGVAQAAVRLHTSPNGNKQLVGYFTTEGSRRIEPESLRAALSRELPDYMVPAQLIPLDTMPLMPSGKLDYHQLPEPVLQVREFVAAVTPLEKQIADIWQEVLGISPIGLEDDFFRLGGYSLLATQIVARTRQVCNVDLPLRALFEASRLKDYVEQVLRIQRAGQIDRQPPIELVDRSQPVPLSYSQQRMWFLWQLEPDSPAYNVGGMACFRGPLNVDCLDRALQALILRHEALRTTFPDIDGIPLQRVAPESSVVLMHHDVSGLEAGSRQQWLSTLANEDAHKPFDLKHGPLLRACLIRFSDQEHYFVLTLHHIITEGWAMDIFARELAVFYEAFLEGRPSSLSSLPPLPVQYLDYSVWQRKWLESGEGERQLEYWRRQLEGEQPLLSLPGDRPRPPVQSHRGELYRFDLSEDLVARVQSFNAAQGMTLFMTSVAALAILLYRYSGQSDLRIGVPVANRIRPESEGLIGAFLNTQVLRCQLSGDMTVESLLDQVRQTVIDAQSHQDLPFDQLVDALQPQRSAAYNPLFQVMCNVQRWQFQQTRQLAGMIVEYIVNDAKAIKFDLNLEVTELDNHMGCCLTYSTDLFDEVRVATMATHWRNLLAAMVADPGRPVAELPMFDVDEYRQLITRLNLSEVVPEQQGDSAAWLPVHRLFSRRAAATPDAPALVINGRVLCYGELESQSNRLAHRLRELGVKPEQLVGLALERSFDMVVGLLAILKAGAAYVPFDPDYPRERLYYMLEDSGIRLLLSHRSLFELLGELPEGVERWCLEDEAEILPDYPDSELIDLTLPQHQAYLIYTSGSTGRPKGVVVNHGPLSMHCQSVIREFGMTADDCELHFYSINFDAATERLLTPLLCGAKVVLRAQGQWAVEEVAPLIVEYGVTILGFTPSYGCQLAQWVSEAGLRDNSAQWRVRLCITGGEALTSEYWRIIHQAFQPDYFFNAYGPTETVVMPLAALITGQSQQGVASLPIGQVIGDRVAYILDENLLPVPPGATGELYVGGAGLARGYHHRPRLTSERFVPNSFAGLIVDEFGNDQPAYIADRLYRTGDLVRMNPDGLVEYIGRTDDQVKIRGFRIELGEIESCILALPEVREAAVVALDNGGHLQLVGYVGLGKRDGDNNTSVVIETAEDLKARIQAHLRQQLPDYMVPAQLMVLGHLPLTPNGKLDRKALPAPESIWQQHYEPPRSELEQTLAAIWGSVLNVEQVSLDHNFFELGGDSILSIQVVSRARKQDIHFKPRDLFQHQTVRALATVVTVSKDIPDDQDVIDQRDIVGPSPMTPIQHWFFESDIPNPHHWNQAIWLDMDEPLDTELLEQALQHLVRHHDSLRLTFTEQEGAWQAIYRELDTEDQSLLTVKNIASLSEIPSDYCDTIQHSLNLSRGPLLRGLLLNGPDSHQRLLLVIHHLVVDGVSWRILLEDLEQGYWQLCKGEAIRLSEKTSAFRDWAMHLHAYADSEAMPEALAWWQSYLHPDASSNTLKLVNDEIFPCDFPEGENLEKLATTVTIRLSREQTQSLLQRAPKAYRTQVNDLLLTALSQVLCDWTDQSSTLIQLESHGRDMPDGALDLTRTTGWFTAAYPVRLTPGVSGLGAAIKAVKEQLRAVQPHALEYGVLRYLADDALQQAMGALPEARITFNYLGQIDQGLDQDGLFHWVDVPVSSNRDPEAPLPNWISIDGQVQGGELSLRWTYSAARYREATIAALAESYRRTLEETIDHCLIEGIGGFTPSDFPLAKLSQPQLDVLPIPAVQIEDIYPLTPMQEGLLLHTLLEPGTGIYYMQDRYRINSPVDPQCFAQAWQAVVARHEALRTSFSWNAGEAMVQIVHKSYQVPVNYLDWRDASEEINEQRLQDLLKTEREAGFDLLNTPPFHLRLIRIDEARYWFMMSNHHILIDAWCRSLLMGDFFIIYSALIKGATPSLPVPPRYRDYIAWLGRQDLEATRQWWQQNLRDFTSATPIASDRPLLREHAGDNGGMIVGDCYSRLNIEDSRRLQELARRNQLTVNTFAQGAWALVLRRISGQRDVLFGVTVAGRPTHLPELQQTVGLFINSIPLRATFPDVDENRSVNDWLRQLLDHNLELRDHEYLSLVDIQRCSEVPKGEPLFDSLFVFENAPVEMSVLDQAREFNATSDSGRTHTNFPLTAVCYPGGALGLHISYDQRYFDRETIEAMLGEFQRLLLALIDGFDQSLADIPLISAEETRFLMQTGNQTERHYPLQSYIRLFEESVAIHPERIAASCFEQRWSYGELNRYANRLGHHLLTLGNMADRPVALLAERSLPLLGMMIGTFKAGAGYLPLDPDHPAQRLADMIHNSGTPVLVCNQDQRGLAIELLVLCPEVSRPKLIIWEEVQQGSVAEDNPGIYGCADNLAYVIYTSGSTGQPKGVMVTQGGMLNNQLSKVPYLKLGEDDVIAQTASQCFDISVWQFLTAPLFGGRVAIIPNEIAHYPAVLLEYLVRENITVLESVPAVIQGMLEEDNQPLPALRWLLPTGEAMPPQLAKQWLERYPTIGLVNAYGPAECSDDVAFFTITEDSTIGSYLPIGLPTDNNRIYLLDEALHLVPTGTVGELYVAGTGVGRGYLADPVRSVQAFLPDVLGGTGERLYRTGDLARRRRDGLLEYVGRVDQQVKIRGFRIELGEIESCLLDIPEVREAAVMAQAGATGAYLVGYLTPTKAPHHTEEMSVNPQSEFIERCKSWLSSRLPDYMVPAYWQVLPEMPRNSNGKLDRRSLPSVEIGSLLEQTYVAPRNSLEQSLAEIWADVLKVEQVGIHDNFFQLGGHSLLATQIASRVQKTLQREVPLRAMFECHTVESLAEYIDGLAATVITEEKVDRLSDLMTQLETL